MNKQSIENKLETFEIGITEDNADEAQNGNRKELSLIERMAVIEEHEQDESISSTKLAKKFNASRNQIINIIRYKEDYMKLWHMNPDVSRLRRTTPTVIRALSNITFNFYKKCKNAKYKVTEYSLKYIATTVAALLNIRYFRPSNRWIARFARKYKLDIDDNTTDNTENAFKATQVFKIEDLIIEMKSTLPAEVQAKLGEAPQINIEKNNENNSTEVIEITESAVEPNEKDDLYEIEDENLFVEENDKEESHLSQEYKAKLIEFHSIDLENELLKLKNDKESKAEIVEFQSIDIDKELLKFKTDKDPKSQALSIITFLYCLKCKENGYGLVMDTIKYAAHTAAQLLDIKDFNFYSKPIGNWFMRFQVLCKLSIIHGRSKGHIAMRKKAYKAMTKFKIEDIIIKYKSKLPEVIQENVYLNVSKLSTARINDSIKTYENKKIPIKKFVENYNGAIADNGITLKSNTIEKSDNIPLIFRDLEEWYEPIQNLESNAQQNEKIQKTKIEDDNIYEMNDNDEIISKKRKMNDETAEKKKLLTYKSAPRIEKSVQELRPLDEENVKTTKSSVTTVVINNVEEAINYLKPLEEFALLTSNFRAINYVCCLEDVFLETLKNHKK